MAREKKAFDCQTEKKREEEKKNGGKKWHLKRRETALNITLCASKAGWRGWRGWQPSEFVQELGQAVEGIRKEE